MTWTSEDHVEDVCRAKMTAAMIGAVKEAQLSGPRIPKRFIAAANTGVVLGMADALIALLADTTEDPDISAEIMADYVRTGVAIRTSAGSA